MLDPYLAALAAKKTSEIEFGLYRACKNLVKSLEQNMALKVSIDYKVKMMQEIVSLKQQASAHLRAGLEALEKGD